ncbi:MAG: phosphate ABC transporter substrate-binding/OmpA family protein [Hyphomicrobiaceae bacterium]
MARGSAGISAIIVSMSALALSDASSAAEITLQMRGGDFQLRGDLQSYDGARYTIQSRALGTMALDATRFECVGENCPKGPIGRPVAAATGSADTVSISGSNTVGNQLMPALVAGFAASTGSTVNKIPQATALDLHMELSAGGRPAGLVQMHRHGSSTAFSALEKGEAEIGMSSRPIKLDEIKKLQSAGFGDLSAPGNEHILGLDGLMVLTSPGNNIVSLSIETIAKIFAGQITDWAQVGQPAGTINVYAPTEDSGTFDTFKSLVLDPRKLKLSSAAKRTENHAEQSDWVAADPNGIGFTGIAYARNAKALNIETTCGLVIQPSTFAIKTEEYPLARRLYLYTNGTPKTILGQNILQFALSEKAQPIVKSSDFIDQTIDRLPYESQTPRMANALNAAPGDFDERLMKVLMSDIRDRERVSTTFRFNTGSFELDNKALADIARLRNWLSEPAQRGKTVLLAGFADTVGSFGSNKALSDARAQAVLRALGPVAGPRVQNKGYSELAPASCNDTDLARQFNRRVEVWISR